MDSPYEFLSRTGDGVCVVDGEQRIVLWNDAASGLLGFAPDEALGRPCYEVLGGTDEAGCAVCRRNCAASLAARRGEPVPVRDARVRTRDEGRIPVSVSTISLPATWHDLSVLAHLFRHVDARKERKPIGTLGAAPKPSPSDAAAGARPKKPIDGLTNREYDVLRMLSTGASTESICAGLGIATTTTRAHIRSILSKLGVRNRLEAVTFGVRSGLLEIGRGDELPPGTAQG